LTESRSQTQQLQRQQQTVMTKAQEPRPVKIMSDKKVAGKRQYRVKYTDGKIYLCDWVNRPLLDHYKIKQQTRHSPNLQTCSNQWRKSRNHY